MVLNIYGKPHGELPCDITDDQNQGEHEKKLKSKKFLNRPSHERRFMIFKGLPYGNNF